MAGKSDYLENKILEHVLKNTAYTSPATVYMALFTATPSDSGGGTEVSGSAYARTAVTFGAAASGAIANSAAVEFPVASGGNWGTITHFGIFDASSGGNLLYWAALSASKVVNDGEQFKVAIGDLDVTED